MKVIKKTRVYRGHFTVFNVTIEDDRDIFEREQFYKSDSVGALLYDTKQNKFVLVKQFRTGAENYLTEIVAGTVEQGEKPETTIKREIEEETGYVTDRIEFICTCFMSPGSNTEKMFLYYCEVSEKVSSGGGNPDEHEKIELIFMEEITDPYKFEDAKTIIAFEWYLRSRNKKGS